tara:strand:+ start:55531 stop:56169 length:639 start_codon:yes stop_codon:yes gene_type:complete
MIQGSITGLAVVGATAVVAMVGLRFAKADAANAVYKSRLQDLSSEYETLRTHYNSAVRQTAVTELVVRDRSVTVQVRTIEGTVETIETDANADKEIYVDFALIEGRLWIRRVFDADTPPSQATLINPKLAQIDWDQENALVGQAVYRQLGEGRWVVNTSGDGALALTRVPEDQIVNLAPPPEIGNFDEIQSEVSEEIDKVSWRDVFAAVLGD